MKIDNEYNHNGNKWNYICNIEINQFMIETMLKGIFHFLDALVRTPQKINNKISMH